MEDIYPIPRKREVQYRRFKLDTDLKVYARFDIEQRLQRAFSRCIACELTNELNGAQIQLTRDESIFHPEGYRIQISESGIHIEAHEDAGFFYAAQTLSQSIDASDNSVAYQTIEDSPDLSTRGYMQDISRCKVPKMEELFLLIDHLAALRYNQFQLYIEHTFAYREHERVWQDASPLTAEEIAQIDEYCKDRYIDFVPNQNSFGHMERWLRHEEYHRLAESPNGFLHPFSGQTKFGSTLKPNKDSLYFLESLYDEFLPNFSSNLFNVGCDEPWELGQGWSCKLVEEKGKHSVYLDFLNKIHSLVDERGKRMQFWGDIILEKPTYAEDISPDAIALIWGYEANHSFPEQCAVFKNLRRSFYIAPGTSSWNTIGGRFENAINNVESAIANAIRFEADGFLLTDWGDSGHHQPPCISYPAITLAAGNAWNTGSRNRKKLNEHIGQQFFGNRDSTVPQMIERLGRVCEDFQYKPHNSTPLNQLLFAKPHELDGVVEKISTPEIMQVLQSLGEIEELIGKESNSLITAELDLASDLLTFACKKGLGESSQIAPLIERYRDNWNSRNRPGGLEESVSNLRDANPDS